MLEKQLYFFALARSLKIELGIHRKYGLRTPDENDVRSWRNVSKHCLIVAARCRVLGEVLGLPESVLKNLQSAAMLHDFYKKFEIAATKEETLTFDVACRIEEEAHTALKKESFDPNVYTILEPLGNSGLLGIDLLLAQDPYTDIQLAQLILFYIDCMTMNDEWAAPNGAETRIQKNEMNPKYAAINQGGLGKFKDNETTYQAQRRIAHAVEDALRSMIKDHDPNQDFGQYIDRLILDRISRSRD